MFQAQMFFTGKKIVLFCVADPDFENLKYVNIYRTLYSEKNLEKQFFGQM